MPEIIMTCGTICCGKEIVNSAFTTPVSSVATRSASSLLEHATKKTLATIIAANRITFFVFILFIIAIIYFLVY